ncbi:hypothetical protein PSCLAVI8L_180166 [Pseudoclavibacter sp. 8L]|nr:hypothetical protein PSCLAVI8L_180166 [Pseudoclavibacter sp. 8L]
MSAGGSWQDARPGDLWVLTLDSGETRTAAVKRDLHSGRPCFSGEGIGTPITDHHIVGGRRVHPEAREVTDAEVDRAEHILYGSALEGRALIRSALEAAREVSRG